MSGDRLILTEDDRGREVPVHAGQEIELRLPENPTTGMRWAFDKHPGVEILEDRNDVNGLASPGAGGQRVFRLRVLGAEGRVEMTRSQAWEPDAEPDATFELKLTAE